MHGVTMSGVGFVFSCHGLPESVSGTRKSIDPAIAIV